MRKSFCHSGNKEYYADQMMSGAASGSVVSDGVPRQCVGLS